MVRFACPLCAAMVQMPDDQVGRRRPCPECGERILVSAPETTPQPVLVDTLPPPQELPPPTTVEEETVSLDPPAPPPVRERSSLRLVQVATCPFCSTRMRIPPDTPSPQFQCPSCHQVFTVAGSTSSPATRPPPPPPPGLRGLTVLGVVVLILALATTAAWGLPRALTWIQTLQAQQETIPNQAASEDNNPPEDTTGPRAPPEGASQAPRENPTPPPQPPPVSPEAVHQTLVSLTDPMAPAPDSKDWADASRYAVQQGPLRVRVEDLSARADQVQIHLQVENESTDRTMQFQKWSTAQGVQAPALSSDLASSY
ncbi:MAG: hypothetical protein JO112_08395, partial [Planctomycetes bacterium]|nr:hypothetical protein [Planctomycetota bacterium]